MRWSEGLCLAPHRSFCGWSPVVRWFLIPAVSSLGVVPSGRHLVSPWKVNAGLFLDACVLNLALALIVEVVFECQLGDAFFRSMIHLLYPSSIIRPQMLTGLGYQSSQRASRAQNLALHLASFFIACHSIRVALEEEGAVSFYF